MPKEILEYFKKKKAEYGAKLAASGVRVLKEYGDGGKMYYHGGKHNEISGSPNVPGFSMKSTDTQAGFDVKNQSPIMQTENQLYYNGLPVSMREAKLIFDEATEGQQNMGSFGDLVSDIDRQRYLDSINLYDAPGQRRVSQDVARRKASSDAGTQALLQRLAQYMR